MHLAWLRAISVLDWHERPVVELDLASYSACLSRLERSEAQPQIGARRVPAAQNDGIPTRSTELRPTPNGPQPSESSHLRA